MADFNSLLFSFYHFTQTVLLQFSPPVTFTPSLSDHPSLPLFSSLLSVSLSRSLPLTLSTSPCSHYLFSYYCLPVFYWLPQLFYLCISISDFFFSCFYSNLTFVAPCVSFALRGPQPQHCCLSHRATVCLRFVYRIE